MCIRTNLVCFSCRFYAEIKDSRCPFPNDTHYCKGRPCVRESSDVSYILFFHHFVSLMNLSLSLAPVRTTAILFGCKHWALGEPKHRFITIPHKVDRALLTHLLSNSGRFPAPQGGTGISLNPKCAISLHPRTKKKTCRM